MVTLSYHPEIRSMFLAPIGHVLAKAQVLVSSDDFSLCEKFPPTREGYKRAERFLRLLERGYEPITARMNSIETYSINKANFERWFDTNAHQPNLPVPFIPVDYVSAEDVMFTGELTPDERERLYTVWLQYGDEIFHFESTYFDDVNIPALLTDFRARAQSDDDRTGNWSHSHHLDLISY